jgi:hypothetical protein
MEPKNGIRAVLLLIMDFTASFSYNMLSCFLREKVRVGERLEDV